MKIALLTTDNRENNRQYDLPEPYFGLMEEGLIDGFQQIPGIEVHVLSCVQKPVRAPENLGENIFYHSILVPKAGWLRSGYQGCIRAVRRKLRELQPDIVHGQGTERDCAISAVLSGYPNVLTIHGNMRQIAKLYKAKPWSYLGVTAFLEPWVLRRTAGVVCNNRYSQNEVGDLNRRTWIIPNAVEPKFFAINPSPAQPPVVLCVGVVSERKNQTAFIEAIAPLQSEFDFQVRFLGIAVKGDPYSERFLQTVRRHPWTNHLGFAGREELRKEFSKASLLVLPTLEDNCPMVVLEAMSSGVPVIASAVGGVPELITDGVNGLLFDPLQTDQIQGAFRKAIADRIGTNARTVTARRNALDRFHPDVVATQHLAVYEEVLSVRSGVV
jgi:glycosyltransferase involved in cell wall biosynthesis